MLSLAGGAPVIQELGVLICTLLALIAACVAVLVAVQWQMKRQERKDKEAMRRHAQGEYPKWM